MRIYNLFYLVGSESLDEEVKSLQDRMMTKIEEMGGDCDRQRKTGQKDFSQAN